MRLFMLKVLSIHARQRQNRNLNCCSKEKEKEKTELKYSRNTGKPLLNNLVEKKKGKIRIKNEVKSP